MSSINGRLTTCDRCGEQVFSKCTGEGEADGGWTRWNKFESLPGGWSYHGEIGSLCPKCSEKYKSLIDTFKKEIIWVKFVEGQSDE